MTPTDISMRLNEAVLAYFQGEKIEALVFILPIGLLSLVFGAWLTTDGAGSFARGVAIPFVLMGLLMTTVGAVVGFRAPAQVSALVTSLSGTPEAAQGAVVAESARMDKVNHAWHLYLVGWGVLGVLGLALRFATRGDFSQGLGIAMVLFCGVGLLVDGFAERRARVYADALCAPHVVTPLPAAHCTEG